METKQAMVGYLFYHVQLHHSHTHKGPGSSIIISWFNLWVGKLWMMQYKISNPRTLLHIF